jgi:hypothetical protein
VLKSTTRRGFGRICAAFAATALVSPHSVVSAADQPKADPASAQGKALGYVHDAATVDTGKFANYVAGSQCDGCQLYLGGEQWGGCGIFPGQQVNAKGWCTAWVKKAG